MADNLTKQLIETVKNKVPLTGGLSIKGYPVMGTLSDMKNFKIEEGVLKLRYGTKTIASFDEEHPKRFYFLKNFEFCGAEVLFGLDYQLCLHAFFENYEGYDFIVRDASQFHKNEMIFRQGNATLSGNYRGNNYWEAGLLFGGGSQFWAYENQKYIMFFNDHGEIRVIVKDGGFKVHKAEQYIEVDIKDATNRVFDVPPALKADTRNIAPRITGEYRFARVNELGVVSELTEPQYLQNWQSQIALYGDVKMLESVSSNKQFTNGVYDTETVGLIFCIHSNGKYTEKTIKPSNPAGTTAFFNTLISETTPIELEGCYLFSNIVDLSYNKFYLDITSGDINDIYDVNNQVKRVVFRRHPAGWETMPRFYEFDKNNDSQTSFSNCIFNMEQGLVPAQWFENSRKTKNSFAVFSHLVPFQATNYAIHARNKTLNNYKAPEVWKRFEAEGSEESSEESAKTSADNALSLLTDLTNIDVEYDVIKKSNDNYVAKAYTKANVYTTWGLFKLETEKNFFEESKGEYFTFTWWECDIDENIIEHQISGEGRVYAADSIQYNSDTDEITQRVEYTENVDGQNCYELAPMDTVQFSRNTNEILFGGEVKSNSQNFFLGSLQDNGRFAIWNDNRILSISQRLFVDKNNPDVPVYLGNNIDPENLLVRYSPVLSLEFMNQRSFRFELPLIRRAIRKPQFLCVSNNYVYEFEDNRLWYGSAYDFMLTGYTYLDGSLLKLIAYNEGILACTTSGLYYVNRETVQPVVNGRAIRADFAGETQVGGIVIAENKVYIVRTEITDSGARIETANLISEPINELVFNGEIKLACNKRQLYLADDYNVYGFDTRAGIWNLRYNYGNKRIADIFILDNRLGILFDNEVDAAKANEEIKEILPR